MELQIRRRYTIPAQVGLTWSVALNESSIDCGEPVDLTVSVALSGYVPAVGEFAYITLTKPTPAEFAIAYPGDVEAKSSNGYLTGGGYTEAMITAIELLGGTGIETSVEGVAGVTLGFKIDTFTSVSITRTTAERAFGVADARLAHKIANPSNGTLAAATDSCELINTAEAPSGGVGALSYMTLGGSPTHVFMDVLSPPGTALANNTRLGEIQFWDEDDIELVPTACVFQTDGDAGGRFKIVTSGGNFYLDTTGVLADYEGGPPNALGQFLSYTIAITGTVGADSIPSSFQIRPRYQLVDPTGNETATVLEFSTCNEFKNALAANVSNRTLRPAASVMGQILRAAGYSQTKSLASNMTWDLGGVVLNHRRGLLLQNGRNNLVQNAVFAVGTTDATSIARKDIDNLVGGEGDPGMLAEYWLFDHCLFVFSNDELARFKTRSRNARFHRCIFALPLHPAYHTKTNAHNYGPAYSDRAANGMWDKCVLWGCTTRMVETQGVQGFRQVNCISGWWWDGAPAIRLKGGRGALSEAVPFSAIAEANLFVPQINNAAHRSDVIQLQYVQESISHVHVPETGDYMNHFVHPATDDFSDDPITSADGTLGIDACSSSAALRSGLLDRPFEHQGLIVEPTGTDAQRRFLWDDILDDVGPPGIQLAEDIKAHVRAGTNFDGIRNISPEASYAFYGAPNVSGVPWNGATPNRTAVARATTGNITLSGEQNIDGGMTSASSVLVKDQITLAQNGIYTSAAGAWARRADSDTGDEILGGCVQVTGGAVNGGSIWSNVNQLGVAITVGTTSITYRKYLGHGII